MWSKNRKKKEDKGVLKPPVVTKVDIHQIWFKLELHPFMDFDILLLAQTSDAFGK